MKTPYLLGVIFIVAGLCAIAFGGFSFVSETHSANIGPLHLQVIENKRVAVPLWAGLASVIGGVLILVRGRR